MQYARKLETLAYIYSRLCTQTFFLRNRSFRSPIDIYIVLEALGGSNPADASLLRPKDTIPRSTKTPSQVFDRSAVPHTSMKVFSNVCSFDYSWEEVSTANWRKYCPWNDKSTHVISVDTISRHVDPETGIVSLPFCPN